MASSSSKRRKSSPLVTPGVGENLRERRWMDRSFYSSITWKKKKRSMITAEIKAI